MFLSSSVYQSVELQFDCNDKYHPQVVLSGLTLSLIKTAFCCITRKDEGGNQSSVSHLSIFGSDAPLWIKLSAFKLDRVNKT